MATDTARGGFQWVGGADHGTALADDIFALPNHSHHGCIPIRHVIDQSLEEGTRPEIGVVLLGKSTRGDDGLDGHELITALLEARHNLAYQATLNAIGLNGDKSTLRVLALDASKRLGLSEDRMLFGCRWEGGLYEGRVPLGWYKATLDMIDYLGGRCKCPRHQ